MIQELVEWLNRIQEDISKIEATLPEPGNLPRYCIGNCMSAKTIRAYTTSDISKFF